MNPTDNNAEQSSATNPGRKRWLVLASAGLAVIVLAGIILVFARSSNDAAGKKSARQPVFQNWLEPNSTIKIGGYRYVSPCRALPKQTAESAFGALSGRTVIQETYTDKSIKPELSPPQLRCLYNPARSGGQEISLETEQYFDAAKVKELGFSLGSFTDKEVQEELDLYTSALTKQQDKTALAFLQKLKDSYATYKKYEGKYSKDLTSFNPDGLVLPISDSISGALTDFAFVGVQGNVVYTIGHTPTDSKGRNGVASYSASELVNELVSMQKATSAVAANIAKHNLDQSPAPTAWGNADKFGSTTILEPCAVMTPSVLKSIIGHADNELIHRTTVLNDINTKYYTSKDKSLILPSNKCERQYNKGGYSNSTYATFELTYGSSTQQAIDWLSKYYKPDKNDKKLKTSADWAYAFANPIKAGYDPIVEFRVGPYIGTVNIYSNAGDGGYDIASIGEYTKAINAFTASLKDNIAHIQQP